jgi:hypothetical protein
MPFDQPADVVVEQIDDKNWRVRNALSYRGTHQRWTVEPGAGTDFASVPRVFVWFLPRYGRYTKAAILHDHLWRTEAPAGNLTWVEADGVFRRAMRELDVPFLRRWIMWSAVRWGALTKPNGIKGWLRESPRVILMTVVALPFVLPPAAVIAVCLLLFWVFELIVFVPLKIGSWVKERLLHQDAKPVNPPSLDAVAKT